MGLAALGSGLARLSGSAPRTASAQAGPWTGGDVPLASRSSRHLAAAARAFLNGLGADQLARLQYPDLGDPVRTTWSNFPSTLYPRVGVPLGGLDDGRRVLLHDLLPAPTSSQGYLKLAGSMRAEDVLHEQEPDSPLQYGSANFFTTVFGSPEDAN